MINIESYIPAQGTLTAVCRNTHDSWNNTDTQQLSIGKTHEVEYAIIGRSWTMVSLKEFPNKLYNPVLFNFYINSEDIGHILGVKTSDVKQNKLIHWHNTVIPLLENSTE